MDIYDFREYISEIGVVAWGYLEYEREIPNVDAIAYELRRDIGGRR